MNIAFRSWSSVIAIEIATFNVLRGMMSANSAAILGWFGIVLSTASLLPQVIRTWRTRSTNDLSASWLIFALGSMLIWIVYGSLVDAPAIVWANALTFVQAASILAIKVISRTP
jgi:MtN3 and saliva related transmembrane protein